MVRNPPAAQACWAANGASTGAVTLECGAVGVRGPTGAKPSLAAPVAVGAGGATKACRAGVWVVCVCVGGGGTVIQPKVHTLVKGGWIITMTMMGLKERMPHGDCMTALEKQ